MAKAIKKRAPNRRKAAPAKRPRKPQKPKKLKKARNLARRYDPRLEFGLQYVRGGDFLAEAARKIGVTPARLRSYVAATGIVTRKNGTWHFKRDRRFRRMPLYSDG